MFARLALALGLALAIGLVLSIFIPVVLGGGSLNTAPPPYEVKLAPVASGFNAITEIANAGDGRLFVVEQAGPIKIVLAGNILPAPFLDLTGKVACCGERGVLGLAFHPNYATNRHFYVNYTYLKGGSLLRTRVARFTADAGNPNLADPASEEVLLEFAQPYDHHKGGSMHFGGDGYLYIATGDGGDADDPLNNAQNTGVLLGKILRIDVNSTAGGDCNIAADGHYGIPASNPFHDGAGGKCDEIWAYGLRNPWRISFDRQTHDFWIADVGEAAREEVNFQAAGSAGGQNYGWDCIEGTLPHIVDPSPVCAGKPATVAPLYEYEHIYPRSRCAVTGGYVYRGATYPSFGGAYFFADFCTGDMWALKRAGGRFTVTELTVSGAKLTFPRTFGEDAAGELYVASSSTVYKLTQP